MSNKRPLSNSQKENVEYSNNIEQSESEYCRTKSRKKSRSESPKSDKENITDGNSSVSEYASSNYSSPESSSSDIERKTRRRIFFIMQDSVPQKLLHTQTKEVRMTLITANTSNKTVKQNWIQKRESLIMIAGF